jgi:hypothetical protein
MTKSLLDFVRTWSAQREVTVRGLHFMQEDSPHEIGRAIVGWLASIPQSLSAPAGIPRTMGCDPGG